MRKVGYLGHNGLDDDVGGVGGKAHAPACGVGVQLQHVFTDRCGNVLGHTAKIGWGEGIVKAVDLKGGLAHVVQPYVATDRIITVYSLGNFVSNQRKRYTDGSILAEIEVEKRPDSVCRLSLKTIPIWVKTPGHEIVSSAHDSEVILNEEQRAKYDLFLRDTEQLLKQGIKH